MASRLILKHFLHFLWLRDPIWSIFTFLYVFRLVSKNFCFFHGPEAQSKAIFAVFKALGPILSCLLTFNGFEAHFKVFFACPMVSRLNLKRLLSSLRLWGLFRSNFCLFRGSGAIFKANLASSKALGPIWKHFLPFFWLWCSFWSIFYLSRSSEVQFDVFIALSRLCAPF